MTFKVGDRVKPTTGYFLGVEGVIVRPSVINENAVHVRFPRDKNDYAYDVLDLEIVPNSEISSNVNPNHYKFPGGAEVKDISGHLTSFGGQALQYIARATRLDGNNKGESVEDLKKALRFVQWEIDRLEAQ